MRYLLDTHTLFWWLYKPHRLSETARATIADPESDVLASAISAYEMSNKYRLGKWDEVTALTAAFEEIMLTEGFVTIPVTGRHASLAGLLEGRSRDPFDRMIAAQAIIKRVPVLSVDSSFKTLGAEVVW